MGFFSDLKEDLSQAVNELVADESLEEATEEQAQEENILEDDAVIAELLEEVTAGMDDMKAAAKTEECVEESDGIGLNLSDMETLDAMLERVDSIELPEDMDITKLEGPLMDIAEGNIEQVMETESVGSENVEFGVDEHASFEIVDPLAQLSVEELDGEGAGDFEAEEADETPKLIEEPASEPIEKAVEVLPQETEPEVKNENKKEEKRIARMSGVASDETAVITGGMIITGDITSEGSVDVIGCINGNIDILGKLNVTGSIQGNSKAAEIFCDNAQITGEIVSEGSVKIGQSSVVIGNITATSAVIAGAVKGDIDVQGPVILDTSAIVMGNIKSKSVQINNGAVIEGLCSQCYADVNPTAFFEDLKKKKQ